MDSLGCIKEKRGCSPCTTVNGAGDAFHAYIIDWRLPDMNGIEVTRQIRSLDDNTPIIILTAYDWSDIAKQKPELQE